MAYVVIPILLALVIAILLLLVMYGARYKWVSAIFLCVGLAAFVYFSMYQTRVCTEEFCSLGNILYGWIISGCAFVVALLFAIFPRKK